MTEHIETESERLERVFAGLGSQAAKEQARRQEAAHVRRQDARRGTVADERERERRIVRAAMRGPRDLEGAWEQMAAATPEAGAPEIDARYAETSAAAAEAQERLVERSWAAQRSGRVSARSGTTPARGGWESLVERAHAEQARVSVGERDPAFDYLDPDDLAHENEALGTPTAEVVAKVKGPTVGGAGRYRS